LSKPRAVPGVWNGAETARKGQSLAGDQADGRLRRGRNRVRPYRSSLALESIRRGRRKPLPDDFRLKPL
jgi:hypothetical protein